MNALPDLVDPRTLARLERLVLLARRVPPARRRSRARAGRGIEPGGRREYTPGDDPRLIDWPAYARLERLLIKVQEALPEPRLDLLVDGSASMAGGEPSPALRASLAAAALAATAVAREVRVRVWWAGEAPARFALHRPGELVRLVHFLADRRPAGVGGLERAAARIADAERSRGGAVLLTDGLDPGVGPAARRLRARGFDALVVWTLTAAELPPPAAAQAVAAGQLELVDRETGARVRLAAGPLALAEASRARADRVRALADELRGAGIDSEALAPAAPFEAVALGLLRRG